MLVLTFYALYIDMHFFFFSFVKSEVIIVTMSQSINFIRSSGVLISRQSGACDGNNRDICLQSQTSVTYLDELLRSHCIFRSRAYLRPCEIFLVWSALTFQEQARYRYQQCQIPIFNLNSFDEQVVLLGNDVIGIYPMYILELISLVH